METNLARIKVALAVMSDAELDALSMATYKLEQIAPGLLAWLDSACVWQLQHRAPTDEARMIMSAYQDQASRES